MSLMNFLRMNRTPVFLLFAMLALSACDRKTTNNTTTNSVGTPNADTFKPYGTVMGTLMDSSTGEPIVGAIVDVGVAQATTNSNGVFVLSNLPATADATSSSSAAGTYTGVIDLRNVTSPVNMKDTTASPRYPDHVIPADFTVSYSSLQDATLINNSNNTSAGNTVASNHDTPVTGLVSHISLTAAKLSAMVTGAIHLASDGTAVTEAYTVELWIDSNSNTTYDAAGVPKGGTADDYLFATVTTTNANSASFADFAFSNVPAGKSAYIIAYNANKSLVASSASLSSPKASFTTPSDGKMVDFKGMMKPVLLARSGDIVAPYVISVVPEDGSAVDPTKAPETLTLTFNEPLKDTSFTEGVLPTNNGIIAGIADLITVSGTDAQNNVFNPPFTVAWGTSGSSTDYSKLTISVNTQAEGAKYQVTFPNGSYANQLMDAAGNIMSANPITLNGAATNKITFYTLAPSAQPPTAPNDLKVTNATSLNYNTGGTGVVNLDWTASTNAVAYNIYRSELVDGVVVVARNLISTAALSGVVTP